MQVFRFSFKDYKAKATASSRKVHEPGLRSEEKSWQEEVIWKKIQNEQNE